MSSIDSSSALVQALNRFLVSRGWEQKRFFDGETYWSDPLAHHDAPIDDVAYPSLLALSIQLYRDSLRRFRVLQRAIKDGKLG